MTGITSSSMAMFVIKNETHENFACHQLYDGPYGRNRLSFGVYGDDVFKHLHWLRDTLAPAFRAGIKQAGGINLKNIIARALTMGDECHNRCIAGTSRFTLEITLSMLRAGVEKETITQFVESAIPRRPSECSVQR
jgi:hypothetical protein